MVAPVRNNSAFGCAALGHKARAIFFHASCIFIFSVAFSLEKGSLFSLDEERVAPDCAEPDKLFKSHKKYKK